MSIREYEVTTLRLALPNEILADINNTRKAHGIFSALMHTLKIIKGHPPFTANAQQALSGYWSSYSDQGLQANVFALQP